MKKKTVRGPRRPKKVLPGDLIRLRRVSGRYRLYTGPKGGFEFANGRWLPDRNELFLVVAIAYHTPAAAEGEEHLDAYVVGFSGTGWFVYEHPSAFEVVSRVPAEALTVEIEEEAAE